MHARHASCLLASAPARSTLVRLPARAAAQSRAASAASGITASERSESDAQVQKTAQTLLPPLQLYRRIFRAHRRRLNPEMRSLGDNYLKDEFRRHQDIDNPLQIVGFLSSWKYYLDALELDSSDGSGGMGSAPAIEAASRKYFEGRRLDPSIMDKLSEEQLYQLHELMQATQEVYNPAKAQGKPPGKQ